MRSEAVIYFSYDLVWGKKKVWLGESLHVKGKPRKFVFRISDNNFSHIKHTLLEVA